MVYFEIERQEFNHFISVPHFKTFDHLDLLNSTFIEASWIERYLPSTKLIEKVGYQTNNYRFRLGRIANAFLKY